MMQLSTHFRFRFFDTKMPILAPIHVLYGIGAFLLFEKFKIKTYLAVCEVMDVTFKLQPPLLFLDGL